MKSLSTLENINQDTNVSYLPFNEIDRAPHGGNEAMSSLTAFSLITIRPSDTINATRLPPNEQLISLSL